LDNSDLLKLLSTEEGWTTPMRFLTKVSLGMALLLCLLAAAPATKADPIQIQSGGFSLTNLGNNGGGITDLDSLLGTVASSTHTVNGSGSFVALLNPLTFTTGFTGHGSGGQTTLFNFTQLLTINGQTQVLNIAGSIDIGQFVDTVHILSSEPLTFDFNTFSVDVRVLPQDIDGWGPGVFCDRLKAEFIVRAAAPNPVPEPATISLLGLGLAGIAAKIRQRRKQRNL
jgi:hypothetical protein